MISIRLPSQHSWFEFRDASQAGEWLSSFAALKDLISDVDNGDDLDVLKAVLYDIYAFHEKFKGLKVPLELTRAVRRFESRVRKGGFPIIGRVAQLMVDHHPEQGRPDGGRSEAGDVAILTFCSTFCQCDDEGDGKKKRKLTLD